MRPARKGPENSRADAVRIPKYEASMRPARKGPENRVEQSRGVVPRGGFNEAGPQGAGKHTATLADRLSAAMLQ